MNYIHEGERKIKSKEFEAHVWFPYDEAFVTWPWTFKDYGSAIWRYEELEQGISRLEYTDPLTGERIYDD